MKVLGLRYQCDGEEVLRDAPSQYHMYLCSHDSTYASAEYLKDRLNSALSSSMIKDAFPRV